MSIPWVFVKSMLPFLYHDKYSFQIYRNTNNKNKETTVLHLVNRICRCCSKRHLGHTLTWNFRSSHHGPQHGSHSCWTKWPALDRGNLLQPSSASSSESENCCPELWLLWIMCWNSGHSWVCFCDEAHPFWPKAPFRLTVKHTFQNYRNTTGRFTEIQITIIQKYRRRR